MDFEAATLAYIRHVMAQGGQTAGGLARMAGVSASTLTRALNDPNHKFTLSMKTIEKIATFSKISPAPFFQAKDTPQIDQQPKPPRTNWASRRFQRKLFSRPQRTLHPKKRPSK
jgi:transcriptional regulator with XRE-family HTH domain